MGTKKGSKNVTTVVPDQAPVIVDGSGASRSHSSKPRFQEWKLFMSPRASDVLADAGPRRAKLDDDDKMSQTAEFKSILKEVEELGTSTLDWNDRKKWENTKLVALGAKVMKSIKMPIAVGMGMKRKREQLEEQKRQNDIASGMRSAKRTNAEKKPPLQQRPEERGLRASEGKFKNGILFVTPPSAAPKERSSRKGKGSGDAFFNNEGSSKAKGGAGKTKKKGKSKKKGGKKKGKR